MKTPVPYLAAIVIGFTIAAFFSCNKIKEIAAFDVVYTLPVTTFNYIPSALKGEEELLYVGAVEANLDSILEANGFSAGVVGESEFISCKVTILEPEELTFSWLESARAEIAANPAMTPAYEVGSVVNTGASLKSVDLTLNNVNIRPYLGATFFYLRIFGVLNGPVPADLVKLAVTGQLQLRLEPLQ